MKNRKNKKSHKPKQREYKTPTLTVHGDIRAITRSKGDVKQDGTGKPATRMATGPA